MRTTDRHSTRRLFSLQIPLRPSCPLNHSKWLDTKLDGLFWQKHTEQTPGRDFINMNFVVYQTLHTPAPISSLTLGHAGHLFVGSGVT